MYVHVQHFIITLTRISGPYGPFSSSPVLIVSWGEDGWRIEELINPQNLSNVQDCYLNCKILNLSCFIHLHAAQGFRTAHNLLFRINLIIIYNPVTMSEVGLFSASFPDESLVPIPSQRCEHLPRAGPGHATGPHPDWSWRGGHLVPGSEDHPSSILSG